MMKKLLLLVILIAMSYTATAQNVGINESGTAPDASAVLDVQSSDKGVLFSRLTTTERDAIQNPANFLIILNTTSECLEIYNAGNSSWTEFGCLWNCGNVINDMRDGNIYKTVQIGNQCWMAENLAYLPSVVVSAIGDNITPYYYVYGYNGADVTVAKSEANYNTYGVLYNWPAAMTGASSSDNNPSGVQGVCPTGWHLPSDDEWKEMEIHLGIDATVINNTGWRGTNEGTQLKSTTGWDSGGNGSNSSGFTALPGGLRFTVGSFNSVGILGGWWSATENNGTNAWRRYMSNGNAEVGRSVNTKNFGYSVRCVRD